MSEPFTDPISGIPGHTEPEESEQFPSWFTRLTLALDAGFTCVAVALIYAVFTHPELNLRTPAGIDLRALFLLATFPIAATFLVALCAAVSPQLVPYDRWKAPLNISLPFLWFVFCTTLANLYGTGSSQIIVRPIQAQNALVWSSLLGTLPVLGLQILALSSRVALANMAARKEQSR